MTTFSTTPTIPVLDIYLVRHGETDLESARQVARHTNIPLNKKGIEQARELKEKLQHITFNKIISSDLDRAHQTAQLIGANQKEIITTTELREAFLGSWEGRPRNELSDREHNLIRARLAKEQFLNAKIVDNIESYSEIYARVHSVIQSLIEKSNESKNSTVLVVSHGGIMRAVLYTLQYEPGFRWQINNCAFIKLHINNAQEIS